MNRRGGGGQEEGGVIRGAVFCFICLCSVPGDVERVGRRTGTGLTNHHSAAANAKSRASPKPCQLWQPDWEHP